MPLTHRPGGVSDGTHDGSAQVDGTWQCYGDINGGLYPLPRRKRALTQDIVGDWGEEEDWPDRWIEGIPRVAILDICVMSPVVDKESIDPTAFPPDAVFVSYFWHEYTGPDEAETRAIGRQHKVYMNGDTTTPPVFTLWNETTTGLSEDVPLERLAYSTWFTSRAAYGIEDFDDPNINRIGLVQMRGMVSDTLNNFDSTIHLIAAYPANIEGIDPALDTVNIPDDIAEDKGELAWMFGHQGRSVFGMRRTGPEGEDRFLEPFGLDGVMPIAEAVAWSDVNFAFLKFEGNIYEDRTSFVEENPSGYAVFASMNANEAFLVKNKGGGVVIRGSLNNPTVVKLAGVEPARGAMNIPAITPQGCFYGSTSGVWLWSGADTSECVSMQLDGFFWETGTYLGEDRPGLKGRFSYSYPFVYAPNDWVYDVRTKAWFRLVGRTDDSNPYMFYDTSWDGRIYASPGVFTPNDSCVADVFQDDLLAREFQWRSQPFALTINTDVEVKKIVLVAQGVGVVQVTLEGLAGEDRMEEFVIDSLNRPVRFEKPTSCRVTDLSVTISSSTDAPADDVCAPIVHALHLGYSPMFTIPQTTTV